MKGESQSYKNILRELSCRASDAVFLTDIPKGTSILIPTIKLALCIIPDTNKSLYFVGAQAPLILGSSRSLLNLILECTKSPVAEITNRAYNQIVADPLDFLGKLKFVVYCFDFSEARAAKEAGVAAVLLFREGNALLLDTDVSEFPVICSFEEIQFDQSKMINIDSVVTDENKQYWRNEMQICMWFSLCGP